MKDLYYPDDNWQKISPAELGINSKFEENLNSEILKNYYSLNGIIILKNGYILLENYYNNKNKTDRFNVASVTKSVLSALIGIAIDKGYINSVDDKVIDYFSQYNLSKNRTRNEVTIHQLLSMTAPYAHKNSKQNLGKLIHSENWIEYCLEAVGLGGNNSEFNYSDASSHLLSGILTEVSGLTAREFANKYLCFPIGMNEIPDLEITSFELKDMLYTQLKGWLKDKQGLTIGGWGLTMTLQDMARFGLLYLDSGFWNGDSIISKSWVNKSIQNYSSNYGYFWWLKNIKGMSIYYAMGTGGNMIVCIPALNLNICIASSVIRTPISDRWKLIENYILPYFI